MARREKDTGPMYDTAQAKAVSEAGGVLIYGPKFVDMRSDGRWYLVVSTCIVHGVYGSAIKEYAEERASKIPFAYVVEHNGARPRVGDVLDKYAFRHEDPK